MNGMLRRTFVPWLTVTFFSIAACSSSSVTNSADAGENSCQGKSIGPAVIDADRFISFRTFGDPRVRPEPPCQASVDAGLDAGDASAPLDAEADALPDAAVPSTTCDAGPPPDAGPASCYDNGDRRYNRDTREVSGNCPKDPPPRVLSAEESDKVEAALRAIEGFEGEGKVCGYDGGSTAMYVGTSPTNIRRGYTALMLGHSNFYNVTHVAQYHEAWKLLSAALPSSAP